jgi:hypothetical protein
MTKESDMLDKDWQTLATKCIAAVLAVISALWGVFCLPFAFTKIDGLLYFGPGYLAAFGYFVLLVADMKVMTRRLIWTVCAIVQICWLAWFVRTAIPHDWTIDFFRMCFVWWVVASLASVIGLILERAPRHQRSERSIKEGG